MSKKARRRLIGQFIMISIGLAGFFLMLNSIGTLEGDYITIDTRLSLNVRACLSGFAIMVMSANVYKNLFN